MFEIKKIHEDARGQINIIVGDLKEHKEITLISTRKGFARAGVIHPINDEYDIVLEGQIDYVIGDKRQVFSKGDAIKIPKNTPHYFVSLTDSLIAEWGCLPEEKSQRYPPYRAIVDDINKKMGL